MPFSDSVKNAALTRARFMCECNRMCLHHLGRRCGALLLPGFWEAHHIVAESVGGSDTIANCEALCLSCHQNTRSYGRS